MQQGRLHHISPTEVSEAGELNKAGHQRLRNVSASEPTVFYFTVPSSTNGNTAYIQIEVHPVRRPDSHHPFYDVFSRFKTAHPHHSVDDRLIEQVQYVYDTYIQAVRWTFDSHCFKQCRELLPCDTCSQMSVRLAKESSTVPGPSTMACTPTSEPTFEELQVAGTPNARRSQSISHMTPGDRGSGDTRTGDKRAREPDGVGLEARRKTKQRKPQTVDDIIKNLVSTVLQGSMDNSGKAPMTAIGFEELANSILTRCQATTSSEELDRLLLELADEFRRNMKSVQREAKISAWFNWYFASCLHHFHHQRQSAKRDRGQDQPSCAIEVLHSIVNTLLFTDGVNALSVVSAFAARGHILSGAAKRSAGDRQLIITGVADKLKRKLQVPNDFAIPIPIDYVARILDNENNNARQSVDPNSTATHEYHSSLQACHYLSMPNLAVLRFQATSKDGKLLFGGIPFSDLQARWAAFEDATPQIERLRRLLYLAEDFASSVESPLSQLQASIALLESGNLNQALEALERSEQECLGDHTQSMPEHAAEKLALVRKASSLLLSRFSGFVRDWLEPKGTDTNDSFGGPGGKDFVWDETWDWFVTDMSDLIEPDGTETLSIFFDIH